MATPPRPIRPRRAKLEAQQGLLRNNRRVGRDVVIRTPAGGQLTQWQVDQWLNPGVVNVPIGTEAIIDVYIEQVCHCINRRRNLIGRNGRPANNRMRAMLSQPHQFYQAITPLGGEVAGSNMLRQARISNAEFRQLEYFFIPIILNGQARVVAVSPQHHTIEMVDSERVNVRATAIIFNVLVRFLIHELGDLPRPPGWQFRRGHTPRQRGNAASGNFACLATKALAGSQPVTTVTDIGQGNTAQDELELRHRVIDDLYHQGGWSELILPAGQETIPQRHAWGSEPQILVFSNLPPAMQGEVHDAVTWRYVTLLRHNSTMQRLLGWCGAQVTIPDRHGNPVPRMQGFQQWAQQGNWSQLLLQVEIREQDIRNGQWP